MIISASTDYRAAAQRKLPPFLFHYIDGGAYAEYTMRRNVEDLSAIALRQRVLRNMSELSLETQLFGETLAMPVALAPGPDRHVRPSWRSAGGQGGGGQGHPFTLSTVSVCPIEEVAPAIQRPMWFQLYVLRTAASCATPWSAPRPPASPPWCSPSTCPCPAPATATPTPA